jgi:glycosyltransferase involved in cell wall biosynthesis
MTQLSVVHLQRRPGPGLHSVERLFDDVRRELKDFDISIQVRINRSPSRGFWPRLRDAWGARQAQAAVNHVTGDVHYLCWGLDPRRTILTVLDCVGLHHMSGPKREAFKWLWYTLPLRRCSRVTVISEFTRRELVDWTGVDPQRIQVIYPHLSEEFHAVEAPCQQARLRVLQIGAAPNKNIERLAGALSGLPVDLTVVGNVSETQRRALVAAGVAFVEKSGLSREEILAEYARCDAVTLVSTYEGFGLPIIEAQAVGRPVVTANVCSMPEVAGEGACLVDPLDMSAIRAAFVRLIEDPSYREGMVAKGRGNIERFRLGKIARQYADLYHQVARESRSSLQ